MKCRARYIALTLLLALSPIEASAAPIQWATNGHYYQLVSPTNGITWTDAVTAAAASSFNGLQGHLVTLSSQAEFNFVTTTFPTNFTWIGYYDPTGASQNDGTGGTGSHHAVDFVWADGESNVFTAWLAGEPNNSADGTGENYAWYEKRGPLWGWNDAQNLSVALTGADPSPPTSYLIEYEAAVPEPSTLACGSLIALMLVNRRRPAR